MIAEREIITDVVNISIDRVYYLTEVIAYRFLSDEIKDNALIKYFNTYIIVIFFWLILNIAFLMNLTLKAKAICEKYLW